MKKILFLLLLSITTFAQTNTGSLGNNSWLLNGNNINSNNYLGTNNNNSLVFKTNNLFRATITNGGLFGIGTATPLNDLHIKKASTGEVGATVENTNQTATDYANFVNLNGDVKTTIGSYKFGGYGYTGTESNHDFFIYANNNTAFVMKPNGNIGIGTTPNVANPTNRLYIGGTVGSGLTFEGLNSTSSVTAGAGTIGVTSTGEVVRVASAPAVTTVSNSFVSPNLTTTVNGVASTPISLTSLFTANNGLTKTAQNFQLGGTLTQNTDIASAGFNTTISGDGNVGIGTTTPTAKLTVGNTLSQNTVKILGSITANQAPVLSLFRSGSREDFIAEIPQGMAFGNTPGLSSYTDANLLLSTQMLLNSAGNFGIGTTSPSMKLDVLGGGVFGLQKSASDAASSFNTNILNVTAQNRFTTATITSPEPVVRLIKAGLTGIKYNATADFEVGTYANGISAFSELKIKLANGNTNIPETDVMTLQGSGNVGFSTPTPTATIGLGGTVARTIQVERNTTPSFMGLGLTIKAGGGTVGAFNVEGGNLNLTAGVSTGNANASNIIFSTSTAGAVSATTDNASTEKMRIQANGFVGVATTTPLSTFDVNGSFAGGNIRTITASITCQPTDRYIVCRNGAVGIAVNLPTASTCPRRSYTISRGNGSTGTVFISGVSMQSYTGALTPNFSLGALGTASQKGTWTSDGTTWWLTN